MMTVSCYICSQTCSMSSIVTHIASCAVRWEETQMRLPHHQRQQPPPPPKHLGQVLSGKISEKELEEFNSCAAQEWNRVTLAECKHCKRSDILGFFKVPCSASAQHQIQLTLRLALILP